MTKIFPLKLVLLIFSIGFYFYLSMLIDGAGSLYTLPDLSIQEAGTPKINNPFLHQFSQSFIFLPYHYFWSNIPDIILLLTVFYLFPTLEIYAVTGLVIHIRLTKNYTHKIFLILTALIYLPILIYSFNGIKYTFFY
ncbi:hypothetical protein A2617_01720 [Candidatus Daviesbacteria bacterium RIFOXYD1_FULL_41_10]|uniref:Uncharacterized protein n=1 Tax=Candidatus Daviesbacteria bacterium RIFOXYD1_FULL_41_10 TaxID=1797801 RepID=A0A1F5MZJ9_9BACT|nr:MAG: hypothetical protein A2617_01720 [Candidatus Daviesbacteria bacterium RIFOXYD1_FULL_41_10]